MARLRLTPRFRLSDLMLAVLVVALVLPLAIRRQRHARIAEINEEIARRTTTPLAVAEYGRIASESSRMAHQFDWLIGLMLVVPAYLWLLRSLGVFHRARLRVLARQYAYSSPAKPTRPSAPSRFLSDDRDPSPYHRAGS